MDHDKSTSGEHIEQDFRKQINDKLTSKDQNRIYNLLNQFKRTFSSKPGLTNIIHHNIITTSEKPIHSKPYNTPHYLLPILKKEIDNCLELGY